MAPPGLLQFAAALKLNPELRLHTLALGDNKIGDDGAVALAHGVRFGVRMRRERQAANEAVRARRKAREASSRRAHKRATRARARAKAAERDARRQRAYGAKGGNGSRSATVVGGDLSSASGGDSTEGGGEDNDDEELVEVQVRRCIEIRSLYPAHNRTAETSSS